MIKKGSKTWIFFTENEEYPSKIDYTGLSYISDRMKNLAKKYLGQAVINKNPIISELLQDYLEDCVTYSYEGGTYLCHTDLEKGMVSTE